MDPDIGGIGVLLGLEIPIAATILSLVLGHLTVREVGTKELGITHLASKCQRRFSQQHMRSLTASQILPT